MPLSKVKNLFPRYKFPIHYSWIELIEKIILSPNDSPNDSPNENEELINDINKISKLMGNDYTEALILILDNKNEFTYKLALTLLPLKLSAKKRLSSSGNEFLKNSETINALISKRIPIGNNIIKQREIEYQKKQERREASIKQFKEKNNQHINQYIDFHSLNLFNIQKKSKAEKILKSLIKGKAINKVDFVWLINKGFENQHVNKLFYFNQAEQEKLKWKNTNNPWYLVNSISDYRKADESQIACDLVEQYYPFNFANDNKKLKSALLTTSGGAKRDLNLINEAIHLGIQAHKITKRKYQPCTLIGSCEMMLGNINQGNYWYQKAIKLGFKEKSFEQEIRSIYNRASKKNKRRIKHSLIANGYEFPWLNFYKLG